MDPAAISSTAWNEIGKMLISLWLMVLFTILFAANMLLGHNMIPSLLASHHLPNSWQRVRPVFYTLAVISFGMAILFLGRTIDLAGVLRRFWADYWI